MSKDLKDFIHLYIGCKVIGTFQDQSGSIGILTGVTNGGYECEIQFLLEDGINVSEEPEYNSTDEVKPVLRELSSMTEEESEEWKAIAFKDDFKWKPLYTDNDYNAFAWLLKHHFDLFSLIENGLAISSTTN